MPFHTINPATEQPIRQYVFHDLTQLDAIIDSTHKAWKEWRKTSLADRTQLFHKLADLLETGKVEYGKLISEEMGKPVTQSINEVEKCAWVCRYFADESAEFLKPQPIKTEAQSSFVTFQPIGSILAIMPWNFPFWQVFRFAAPSLMAGNCGILKHAPTTTGCGLAIEKLFKQAGFPEHVFNTIIADIQDIDHVVSNPKIAAATLTGSTNAGKSLASLAGKHLKKVVLELGGSDPYIIMDDADLDLAASKCVDGRLLNSGQSCIAAKRFIVTKKNKTVFTEKVLDIIQKKKVGNPKNANSDLGPMARADLRDQLQEQLDQSVDQGAIVDYQSTIPTGPGFYFPVTLLSNVKKGMPAYDQELFGPVAVIIEAEDEGEAIDIANDTSFGLGSAIFNQNTKRALQIATNELEAGCCFINDFVKSDPRLPFGGIRESGFGRELSNFGIHEFVNIKTIYQV